MSSFIRYKALVVDKYQYTYTVYKYLQNMNSQTVSLVNQKQTIFSSYL